MSNDNEWQEVGSGAQYEMWDEQAEKTIQGVLVEVRKNVGKNNATIYALKQGNGEIKGVWGSTVLDGRFENIPLGTEVKIEYKGKTAGKDARGAYKNYGVFMRKPVASQSEKTVGTESDIPF